MSKETVLKWISSVEKYSRIDEKQDALSRKLLSLAGCLQAQPNLSNEMRTHMIVRLKHLLHHRNSAIVEQTLNILVALTEEFSCLPSDVTLSLMKQSASVYSRCGHCLNENSACIAELLVNLILDDEKNHCLLRSSGCLTHILYVFSKIDYENLISLENLNSLVNLLVAATECGPTNYLNKTTIAEVVIPKVVDLLSMWKSNRDTEAIYDVILKDLLFLCRNVISESETCQDLFLHCEGLETILRVLEQNDLMQEHMFIHIPSRKSMFVDTAPTIFSSLVILLDVSVTHNRKACHKAIELNALGILQQCLRITPLEQQTFIVASIVHLLESEIVCPNTDLLHEMAKIIDKLDGSVQSVDTPTKYYIQKKIGETPSKCVVNKISLRKGTPHPRKHLSMKIKKPLKRLLESPSNSKDNLLELRPITNAEFPPPTPLLDVPLSSQICFGVPKVKQALLYKPEPTSHFLSTAELIIFMNCIKIYGANMHNIRRVYPFHKNLTPQDLYALWRAIWKKMP